MVNSFPEVVTADEVRKIHSILVQHFREVGDPIDPSGVKNDVALESAVSRQFVGAGSVAKYPHPCPSAATLMYGLCMNHPFHNGNKRTALVSALIHLSKNKYTFREGVRDKDIYNMLLNLAAHTLTRDKKMRGGVSRVKVNISGAQRLSSEEEMGILIDWVWRNTRKVDLGEHPVTFRKFRQILESFGCFFDEPNKGFIDIYKQKEEIKTGFLNLGTPRKVLRKSKLMQIAFRGEGMLMEVRTIKAIRKICGLLPENGIDSHTFYNTETATDYFITQYRNLLGKLSHV